RATEPPLPLSEGPSCQVPQRNRHHQWRDQQPGCHLGGRSSYRATQWSYRRVCRFSPRDLLRLYRVQRCFPDNHAVLEEHSSAQEYWRFSQRI
ncbi:hypothetical protein GGI23_006820, partial [Coemansia sp. RSA 2559]